MTQNLPTVSQCPEHLSDSDTSAPWSCAGTMYRIANLEAMITRHEGHFTRIEESIAEHRAEVETLRQTNDATLTTLVKMQETLELMKEVLTTYNHVKSFGSVFGYLGKSAIFIVKMVIACAAIYGFIKFGKVPT